MLNLAPRHGGPDGGPAPRYDFSSNANPVGPCPSVLAAVKAADLTQYPDPAYTALRRRLADYHRVPVNRVVVGAGASELILRLVRHTRGSVQVLGPTFSEYERCGLLSQRRVYQAKDPVDFLWLRRARRGLGFVCWPNNPTGTQWPLEFIAEAVRGGPLVIDLAYAPLCVDGTLAQVEAATESIIRLYAPNKSYSLTGIRAAYAITPRSMPALVQQAPAWVLDKGGEAFLHAAVDTEALRWLAASRPIYGQWRDTLAQAFRTRGYEVIESPATFLLVRVGDARRLTDELRVRGVRVRDCTSFEMPEWIRLSALAPEAQRELLSHVDAIRGTRGPIL